MIHKLPELGYEYDALEPFIDAKTMEIHHTKHHQAYVDKLNATLEKYPSLQKNDVEDLLKDLNNIPEDIRTAVRNHGGGHSNHSFFWKLMKKNVKFSGDIAKNIEKTFGSYEEFKKKFTEVALGRFGSGWAWLVLNKGKLEITSTANQDSPLSEGKIPILGIDVWEHAYYLKHMSNRAAYVEAFFNIINWEQVNKKFKGSK
ncbi:superoxide dismutase [Candidatus Woesearchaeota archaeon]|nr:superoxide dismutase [Candidatus Woesearchaeota archaeon]